MKGVFATLLLFSIILTFSIIPSTMAGFAAPKISGGLCGSECSRRCAKAGLNHRCLKFCGICCRECNCVPSGTSGNKHECPCYRDKMSSKGKPKCP